MPDEKFPPENNLPAGYVPPEIWTWETKSGGTFASLHNNGLQNPWKKQDDILL